MRGFHKQLRVMGRLYRFDPFRPVRAGGIIPPRRKQRVANVMASTASYKVTELLNAWGGGDQSALEKLMPLIYDELHRLADRYMAHERPEHTLQTSALVNEAYVRLVDQRNVHWENRAHFFAIAATSMRRILVSYARRRNRSKRGGGALQVSLDEAALLSDERAAEMVALDEALEHLAIVDPRKSQVVELRYLVDLALKRRPKF